MNLEQFKWRLNYMKCEKHDIELECLGGCSAHLDNWYCLACNEVIRLQEKNEELEKSLDALNK